MYTIPSKFKEEQHNNIVSKLKKIIELIDPKIKLENMTGKFNRSTQKKILNKIKNNSNVIVVACQKYQNETLFQSHDKNVALFFKNRYIFFDSDIDFQDIKMSIVRMINGDNADNKCGICMENIKERTMPCTTCGTPMCLKCTSNLMNQINSNGILKCPYCRSDGIKFNMTKITV